jgi:hypothetical protein
MAWRDRFFTPTTARAILSWRLLLGAAAGVGAWLLGLPVLAAVGIGVVVYGGSVALAMPRAPRRAAIDPFAVGEPWRHFVKDAQRSRSQLQATIRDMPAGPLRDRLAGIADRLDAGLQQGWQIAKRGNEIDATVRRLDPTRLRSRRSSLEARPDRTPEVDGALESVDSQLATADRLKELSATTADRLRLSQARLDELVARAAEVSIGAASTDTYATEVDDLVLELESLRQAVQEVQ